VRAVGIFLFFIVLTLAACEDSTLTLNESGLWGGEQPIAVTDSGRWGTIKSADAAATCTAAKLGNEVTVQRIAAAPKQTIEIHSKVMQAGAPVYIITVTRVDSGLTMIQLRASDHKASLRAKAAAESCLG
jgi:hypothetical protein